MEELTSGRGRRFSLALLGVLSSLGSLVIDLYLPAFPGVATDLGVPLSTVTLSLTTALLGLAVGHVLYGPLSDRFGRRAPLTVGLALFIAASLGCALAPNFATLLVMRFFQSFGAAAGIVIARAIVRDLYHGRELARAFSVVMVVFALTPVAAPSLGAVLLEFGGWRWLFCFCALFGAFCLALSTRLPETLPPGARTSHGFARTILVYGSMLRNARFALPATLGASSAIMVFGYVSTSPAVMLEHFSLSRGHYAVLFGAFGLCLALGAIVNNRLLLRLGMLQIVPIFVGLSLLAGPLILLSLVGGPALLLVSLGIGLTLVCVGVIGANVTAMCLDLYPDSAATAAGLLGVIGLSVGAALSMVLAALQLPAIVEMGGSILLGSALAATLLTHAWRRRALRMA